MSTRSNQVKKHTSWGATIYIIIATLYIGLLLLFGWQTWEFVNFLFPGDELIMKILTLISFDAMALVWAVGDLFYRFASKGAQTWVRIAWVVTFVLSLLASILYLVIQSMFRFKVTLNPAMVNVGYGISIIALVFNIVAMMMFLYLEWQKRYPRFHEFDEDEDGQVQQVIVSTLPQTQTIAAPVAQPVAASQLPPALPVKRVNVAPPVQPLPPRPPLPVQMHEAEQQRHAKVIATRQARRQQKFQRQPLQGSGSNRNSPLV